MKQIFVIIFFSLMFACVHAKKEEQYNSGSKNPCIELYIIPPCAGYLCDGYLIDIRDGIISVYVKNTVLEDGNVTLKNTVDSIMSPLSKENVDSINIFTKGINPFNFVNKEDALDVWIYSIEIDNKDILSLNSASLYENIYGHYKDSYVI